MKRIFMSTRICPVLAGAVLLAGLIACGGGGGGGATTTTPVVVIAAPANSAAYQTGERVAVQSASADANGITRVELYADGQLVQTSNVPIPADTKQFNAVQEWIAAAPGAHALTVRAFNLAGLSGEQTVAISVSGTGGAPSLAPTPANDATPVAVQPATAPPASVTVIFTGTPPPAAPTVCAPDAQFVGDKTIPDGTVMQPGEAFVKTWAIRNNGSCAWGPGFTLNYISGAGLATVNQVPLPPANPGQTVDVSVNMQSPAEPNTYRADWRPRTADGVSFGTQLSVVITVPAPNPPTGAPTATAVPVVFKPPFPGDMTVDAVWFGDSINIGATAAVVESGDEPNGSGIDHVDFFIQDLQGHVIASKRENNAPYCYFGEANGECSGVDINTSNFKWGDGKPIRDGWYFIRAVAHARDGRIKADERALHVTIPEDALQTFFVNLEQPGDTRFSGEFAYEASVSGSHLDSAGVDRVEMYIADYDGNIVSGRAESNPRYCGFGGGDNGADCPVYNFAQHGGKWPNGAPVNPTQYILRLVAYATDGKIVADSIMIRIDAAE